MTKTSSTKKDNFYKSRIRSFSHALNGLRIAFKEELHIKIHLGASILAVTLAFALNINKAEWLWIIGVISIVFAFEIMNSAIEKLCDHTSPQIHPQIKQIKDLAAGAVLVSAVFAAIVGITIFLPKIIQFIH